MLRQIAGVITGYAIFVFTSLALFQMAGIPPHAPASASFMVLTAIYGAVFSFVSGLVAQLIANAKQLSANFILAGIIAGFAIFSFLKASGSHWTQLLAIFIFAPVSVLGGMWMVNKKQQTK